MLNHQKEMFVIWQEESPTVARAGGTRERGASLVESALIVPILIALIVGGTVTLWASYRSIAIKYVAMRAVRNGLVRSHEAKSNNPVPFINAQIEAESGKWGVTIDLSKVNYCSVSDPLCTGQETPIVGGLFVVNITTVPNSVESLFGIKHIASAAGVNSSPIGLPSV